MRVSIPQHPLLCKLLPLLPHTFKPCINPPFASPRGQLKSSIIRRCCSLQGVLGFMGCALGCRSPKEALWSFAFVCSALVVLLLPMQRHWREEVMPFLLIALPFASPRT